MRRCARPVRAQRAGYAAALAVHVAGTTPDLANSAIWVARAVKSGKPPATYLENAR